MLKGERIIVFLIVIGCLVSCEQEKPIDISLRECTSMPSPRACASAFAFGGKVYVFAGRDSAGQLLNDLWMYSPEEDEWTDLGATPLSARVNAATCVADEAVFLGLGFGGGSVNEDRNYLRDWWRYDPLSGTWEQLTPYPSDRTVAPVCRYDGQAVQVACGFHGFNDDVRRYDPHSDAWDVAAPSPMRVMSAVAAECQGRYFAGTGFHNTSRSDWWEWFPDGRWERRTSVPGKGRHNSACASTKEHIWVMGGWHYGDSLTTGFHYDDILRYTPATDQWDYCGPIPCGTMENGVACGSDGHLYFGLGEDKNGHIHTNWYSIEE